MSTCQTLATAQLSALLTASSVLAGFSFANTQVERSKFLSFIGFGCNITVVLQYL